MGTVFLILSAIASAMFISYGIKAYSLWKAMVGEDKRIWGWVLTIFSMYVVLDAVNLVISAMN